jgi:EmrB/QacA subfamily drug resistance transporter
MSSSETVKVPEPASPEPAGPVRNAAVLPYIVAATFFMEYLDSTIIATALPQMAKSFAVGPNDVSLGMTAYMLTLAVFIPISGWIADRVGSRTVFASALVVFVCASVLCGFSEGILSFTGARVLQGMGGALMVPVGRMIVIRNTDKSRMMNAVATITWPAILAPVLGPTVGGFITTFFSWRWVFFINVPFGLLALLAILAMVPNQRESGRRPLDMVGFVLSGVALISLLYGTELASHQDASLLVAVAFMLAGLAVGLVAIRHMQTHRSPLLNLSTMRVPTFAVTVLWGSASRVAIEAVPYLSPLLFQLGFGLSALNSGLLILATSLGNLGMKAFTTPILRRFGFRWVLIANGVCAGVFTVLCGFLSPSTPLVVILVVLFSYGLARSLQFTSLGTLAYADVSDSQRGSAATLWSVWQQMTIGTGIAFGAVCLRLSAFIHGGGVEESPGHFTVGDFRWAFAIAGCLTLFSVIGYVRLPANAGAAIGGGATKRGGT